MEIRKKGANKLGRGGEEETRRRRGGGVGKQKKKKKTAERKLMVTWLKGLLKMPVTRSRRMRRMCWVFL